jgi:hypothetical protein
MDPWLLSALILGATPLAAGIFDYVLWLWEESTVLEMIGLCILQFGPLLFLAGLLCLIQYVRTSLRAKHILPKKVFLNAACAGGLLFMNWPVAAYIVIEADDWKHGLKVKVVNQSSATIQNLWVTGAGSRLQFPQIPPGKSVARRYHARTVGPGGDDVEPLVLTGKVGDRVMTAEIRGYIVSGMECSKVAIVHEDGAVQVTEWPR